MGSVLSCLSATYLVALLSLILLPLFLLRRSKVSRSIEPPLAAGAWPIIGHLSLLSGSKIPHITLGALADKYGPIFTIKLGSRRAVVLSNWKMAKECFTTNDLAVSTRPRLVAIQRLSYNQAMFSFAPHGHYWREVRKIATLELLTNSRIELLSHVRVSEVETSMKALFKLWAEKKNDSGYVLVEMKQWFGELTLNTVLRMMVGKRYGAASEVDEEDALRCLKALREFFYQLGLFVLGDAVPWLRWLDWGGHEKAMKETAKELDAIFGEWLEEHRQKRASGEVSDGGQDFMDVMLSILDGTELGGYDADTINKATSLVCMHGLKFDLCFYLEYYFNL